MHQQKGKKIFFYFFLLIFLGSISNIKINNFEFNKINTITVSGLDKKNNKIISDSLKSFYLQNIFFINSDNLSKLIDSNNLVETYKITKKYPSSIDIQIRQTKFIAKLKKDEKIYIVGTNGKLLNNIESNFKVPFIFGNPEIEEILLLKKAVDQSKFSFDEIKNLYYFQSKRWDVELNNNTLIKLPKKNIEETLSDIFQLIENKNEKKVSVYDARVNNQIIIDD